MSNRCPPPPCQHVAAGGAKFPIGFFAAFHRTFLCARHPLFWTVSYISLNTACGKRSLALAALRHYHLSPLWAGIQFTNSCNKFRAAGLLPMGRSPGFCICAAGRGPRAGPWRRPHREEAFRGIALSASAEKFSFLNLTRLCNENSSNPKASKSSKCASTTPATPGNQNVSKNRPQNPQRSPPAKAGRRVRGIERIV